MAINLNDIFENHSAMSEDEFWLFLDENVSVIKYIDLQHKYIIIDLLTEELQTTYTQKAGEPTEQITQEQNMLLFETYDVLCMFNLLLAYTNIVVEDEDKTVTNYDKIITSGLHDYITNICNKDYTVLVNKTDKFVGIDNVSLMQELMNALHVIPNAEKLKQFYEVAESFDKDTLTKFEKIEKLNNTSAVRLMDSIEKEAIEENIQRATETAEEVIDRFERYEAIELDKEAQAIDDYLQKEHDEEETGEEIIRGLFNPNSALNFLSKEANAERQKILDAQATDYKQDPLAEIRKIIPDAQKVT